MAVKIDKKIVAFKVKSDEMKKKEAEPVDDGIERMHEGMKRPDFLTGATYKIKTPQSDHAIYVTINDCTLNHGTEHESKHPYEVFINSKNMEQFQWIAALTRLLSAVFRKGGEVDFLVDELKNVFDPSGGYFKKGGVFMPSLVAEIGTAIESHLMKA